MSFTRQHYIYLFNTLLHKNLIKAERDWDESDDFNVMKSDWAKVLNKLEYTGRRNNFEIVKQYIDNLPPNFPPPNFIAGEENEEVDNYMESISPPNIESNLPVNQNFIPNDNMSQGIYGLNTDPSMDALIKLVSQLRKKNKKNGKTYDSSKSNRICTYTKL
jgi:hypothetical protein